MPFAPGKVTLSRALGSSCSQHPRWGWRCSGIQAFRAWEHSSFPLFSIEPRLHLGCPALCWVLGTWAFTLVPALWECPGW